MSTAVMPVPMWHTFVDTSLYDAVGAESGSLQRKLLGVHMHSALPISLQSTADTFAELAETWKAETLFLSSVSEMTLHPAYQRIIGLGPAAIPFLLSDLRGTPDHWFMALSAITGVDPILPGDQGDVRRMADAWIRWGEERSLRF